MKRNVTLAVEEEVLREARVLAARRQTSINEMLRDYLVQLVGQENRRQAAWERIRPLVDRPAVHLGEDRPSRDELHER